MLDVILSAAALMVLIPFMAVMAALIKATSSGPVMYRQRRHGMNMRTFTIYKFRTMYVTTQIDPFQQATRHDRRVTPVGRLFRRTSLDELPQFFNVLIGDMSIVGPRPHPIDLDNKYSMMIPEYHTRFLARPGITGLAQVNGARGETPTIDYMQRRVAWDASYVKRASLGMDCSILIGTLRELIASKTAF